MSPDDGAARTRLVARPVLSPGPLAQLKDALYGLYLSAGAPTIGRIRKRILELADGPEVSDPTATPSNDTIHTVLSSSTRPANVHHVISVAAALLYPHQVPGVVPQVRGNPRIEQIRQLWEQATLHRAPGAILVRDARPRLLGVHAAIRVDHTITVDTVDDLPAYVARDFDSALRTVVSAAAERAGFVLVTGNSSVGKTRSLYEAIKAIMPEW